MSSDEEMNPLPEMGGMSESDIGDDDHVQPASELPEGITKEIITGASSEDWRKPKKGDQVQVHYVGTLQGDGSEFDSSRSRGKPFDFTLGHGSVIKGWDLGVATMKKGEVAKFTLAPQFAYGESGSPPKIPENAILVFEIELLSWTCQTDLFNDGTVTKAILKDGSGWKKPKVGEEVKISFKGLEEGSCEYDCTEKDYVLGSGVFGPFTQAVDAALADMKKGEEAELKCTNAYVQCLLSENKGDIPEGVSNLSLTLHELYEVIDVSHSKDKTMMKKQVREGEGYEKPKETNKVRLKVTGATDSQGQSLPGFVEAVVEFRAGDGDVCDALEFATFEMMRGERAQLTCTQPQRCAEPQLGLAEIRASGVIFHLELEGFEKGKDTWSMSDEEKLQYGNARKAVGGNLFKRQRIELALKSYSSVINMFNYVDNFDEASKVKANDLKRTCELNKAACLLNTKDWDGTRQCCNTVLKDESNNIKALLRRAAANKELGEYQDAMKDCKHVLEQDKANADARKMIPQLKELQKCADNKSKDMFANMCKGLGKLNVPGKRRRDGPTSNEGGKESAENLAMGAECEKEDANENAEAIKG